MGLILDTSILIAAEKKHFQLKNFFTAYAKDSFFIASITAAELLHGVERANTAERKLARSALVEQFLTHLEVLDFDPTTARKHAVLWAFMAQNGTLIGPHDLLIAATALEHGHQLATLNLAEFKRVPALRLIDVAPFLES